MASVNYLDTRIDVYAYLVITASDVLLIDTGVGKGNEVIEKLFAPTRTPIVDELARVGVKPGDVNLIVNSHLHFDHCGNNQLFPAAEIFVQADELSIARTPRYTVTGWFDYDGARINPVSGEMDIGTGLKLLATPGHTPGHQSVLVETDNGNVLVAAQAAFTVEEYEQGGDAPAQSHDGLEAQYVQTISRLRSVPAAEVYFSHDDRTVIQ